MRLYVNTVKYVKPRAFYQVNNVTMNLEFGDNIIIEDSSFQECSGLGSIKFYGKSQQDW